MTALLAKTFESEEHLRNTLHQRIKWGALNLHRSQMQSITAYSNRSPPQFNLTAKSRPGMRTPNVP